tara:strand:+ start:80 stop:1966 length:1887 start_codon:yes stop_codon:yes gene_type:complete
MASKNNCNFEANLDNDMIIKPNSSMAVLNATFKSPINQLTITEEISAVSFIGTVNGANTPPIGSTICKLKVANYSGRTAVMDFIKNLQNTLNGTLNCQFSTNAGEGNPNFNNKITNATFGEFLIGPLDQEAQEPFDTILPEKLTFQYAYSPLLTPFGPTAPGGLHGGNGTKNSARWYKSPTIAADIPTNRAKLTAGTARTARAIHHAYPNDNGPICMGTSIYMARVRDYANNTAAGGSPLDNGFGIGLSLLDFTGVGAGDDLPTANRVNEIIFLREGLPYTYRNGVGFAQSSAPLVAARASLTTYPSVADHDVIWFRIRGDQDPTSTTYQKHILEAGVWQEPGGVPTETVFFKREITDEENYLGFKPYMFINGAAGEVEVDAMCYPISPYHLYFADPEPIIPQIDWNDRFADGFVGGGQPDNQPNDYRILTATTPQDLRSGSLGQFAPQVLFDRWSDPGLTFTAVVQMHSDVWDYIGFSENVSPIDSGFAQITEKIGNENLNFVNQLVYTGLDSFNLDADDNFMVLIDNLPVDSYDASKNNYDNLGADPLVARSGRRKNILMTIPVSEDTTKGNLVQFSTNTPIFIDFLNTQELNIRNLKLRILRKNFGIVETGANNSILTVLIKDGE